LRSPVQIAAFGYHEVTDDPASTGFQGPGALPFKLPCDAFAAHLAAFAANLLTPERVTDVDLARPGRHLLVTFDDGGRSALYAAERLAARGWHGHFFVVTSLLGSRTFLDTAGVRELHAHGHVVGSHSHTHPFIFRDQPFARMLEQWRVSRDRLAQILGADCLTASVPGGDISAAVLHSADAAGFRYLFTSEPWIEPRRTGECWVLGRVVAKVGMSPQRAEQLARFRGWGRALLVRRLKNAARAMAPSLHRLLVRRRAGPFPAGEPS
jgi:peptidoglycan/xylan/chitin deacetylase (PgdA/CDA1 family)